MNLNHKYKLQTEGIDASTWCELLGQFDDAIFYQTWAFGEVRRESKYVRHIALECNGLIVAAAQLLTWRVPGVGGLAYVASGPMWKRTGVEPDLEHFRMIIRGLKELICNKEGMLLRVKPYVYDEPQSSIRNVLAEEGFWLRTDIPPYRSLYIDLFQTEDQLRRNLRQTWRQGLCKAEKHGLEVVEGEETEYLTEALHVYDEMLGRKRFVEFVNKKELLEMQYRLKGNSRLSTILVRDGSRTLSAISYSTIGTSGVTLLAATSTEGMALNSSHLMWWRMLIDMKHKGLQLCDLGGIDPKVSLGTYHFKSGIAGKGGGM